MNDQQWKLLDRFKEPSSWSAIAAGLGSLGVMLPPGIVQVISLVGAGLCVLAGILLKEKTSPNGTE